MPAQSKKQQRFMGMVHAQQKGELSNASAQVKSVAKSMSKQDATDFASTKHTDLPEKKQPSEKDASSHLSQMLRMVGLDSTAPKRDLLCGDPSVLSDPASKQASNSVLGGSEGRVNMLRDGSQPGSAVGVESHEEPQPLDSTRVKAARVVREFFSSVLRSPPSWTERQKESMAPGPMGSMSATMPLGAAQGAMQQFLPPAQGPPQLAGMGVPPVGLPAGGQKATPFPGAGNSPATNPIDRNGGLDPAGLTMDGNHAAGVAKGFKMAAWAANKATAQGLREVTAQLYPDLDGDGVMNLLSSLGCQHGRDGSQLLTQLRIKAACCETDDSALFVSKLLWRASQLRGKQAGCETIHSDLDTAKLLWNGSQLSKQCSQ